MNLAAAQAALGAEVELATYGDARNQQWLAEWVRQIPAARAIKIREIARGWQFSRAKIKALRDLRENVDVMHVHGIWHSLTWHSLSDRHHGRAATVLAPHGMLSPWALNHRGFKKKLAMRFGWRRLMVGADLLHAVSMGEQREITAELSQASIALISNGISFAQAQDYAADRSSLLARARKPRYVLYLARLHEMKGPDLLLDAFAEVAGEPECSDYRLIMAGPDYGEKPRLEARVRRLGIEDKVEFPGPVFGRTKRDLYRGATLLCQPSRYDAFSLSILEALAAAVPILTTPESNFPEVDSRSAGIICKGEPHELAANMRMLLLQPELRERMGRLGRTLALEKYTWERIAAGAMNSYSEVVARRANRS